jgi:hypothetical protein
LVSVFNLDFFWILAIKKTHAFHTGKINVCMVYMVKPGIDNGINVNEHLQNLIPSWNEKVMILKSDPASQCLEKPT